MTSVRPTICRITFPRLCYFSAYKTAKPSDLDIRSIFGKFLRPTYRMTTCLSSLLLAAPMPLSIAYMAASSMS